MHIVLLSGGSGKRLWPLSNDVRSKQFIKMFHGSDGELESMVQRVYRQIKTADPEADITIATSRKQVSAIHNQLGNLVSVCVEPTRRDTFPAIALAASYLQDVKQTDREEPVIICPVDPYVDNSYFDCFHELEKMVREGSYGLNLMGVEPTYPSEKYGYIIPENAQHISRVDAFKEKPDLETARRYIQKNNFFWNAGIFVWNVNTVVNALRVYQPAISKVFERLLPYYYTDKEQEMINQNFPLCENISVDYAIMEKADEIFVLPASFGWSDLGTWGSLHENLPKDAHNNTQIGENIKLYETRNCVIHTTQEKRVVVQGLDGYIVAEKNNTLLICRLSEEQRIKEFSAE